MKKKPQREWAQKPPPDDGKPLYEGRIVRLSAKLDAAFIRCDETFQMYGKDVYMWNTYFKQAYLQDIIRFKVHVGSQGMPQVCWCEKVAGPSDLPTFNLSDGLFHGKPVERTPDDMTGGETTAPTMAPTVGPSAGYEYGKGKGPQAPIVSAAAMAPGMADYSSGYGSVDNSKGGYRFQPY
jgi:hypothetical protein